MFVYYVVYDFNKDVFVIVQQYYYGLFSNHLTFLFRLVFNKMLTTFSIAKEDHEKLSTTKFNILKTELAYTECDVEHLSLHLLQLEKLCVKVVFIWVSWMRNFLMLS